MNHEFSDRVHEFLHYIKENSIAEENKRILYDIIMNLEERTEVQRKRFLLYYSLIPNKKENLNFIDIANLEGCTPTAIKSSIATITRKLVVIEDKRKHILLNIIKEEMKQKD